MKVLNNMTLDKKRIKEIVYQGINNTSWYCLYSLPVLYTKGYQKSIEAAGVSMPERRKYTQNMHSILGRMPFKELMKQNPRYVFKNTFGRNQFKDIILWANETGYEYDYYHKHVINDYIYENGQLNKKKLDDNYKKLEPVYRKSLEEFYQRIFEEEGLNDIIEKEKLLNIFKKSYKVFCNNDYCVILNRMFEEKQINPYNAVMILESYVYSEDYRIDKYQNGLTTSPKQFFDTLNYPGEFNKSNFTYACVDNFEETKGFYNDIIDVSIHSKNYILESLSRIGDENKIKEMCEKEYIFLESIENRASEIHHMYSYANKYESVTYEEVINYRKEMNIETNN